MLLLCCIGKVKPMKMTFVTNFRWWWQTYSSNALFFGKLHVEADLGMTLYREDGLIASRATAAPPPSKSWKPMTVFMCNLYQSVLFNIHWVYVMSSSSHVSKCNVDSFFINDCSTHLGEFMTIVSSWQRILNNKLFYLKRRALQLCKITIKNWSGVLVPPLVKIYNQLLLTSLLIASCKKKKCCSTTVGPFIWISKINIPIPSIDSVALEKNSFTRLIMWHS